MDVTETILYLDSANPFNFGEVPNRVTGLRYSRENLSGIFGVLEVWSKAAIRSV